MLTAAPQDTLYQYFLSLTLFNHLFPQLTLFWQNVQMLNYNLILYYKELDICFCSHSSHLTQVEFEDLRHISYILPVNCSSKKNINVFAASSNKDWDLYGSVYVSLYLRCGRNAVTSLAASFWPSGWLRCVWHVHYDYFQMLPGKKVVFLDLGWDKLTDVTRWWDR